MEQAADRAAEALEGQQQRTNQEAVKRQLRNFLSRLSTCDGTSREALRSWIEQVDSALQWVPGCNDYLAQEVASRMTGVLGRHISAWASPLLAQGQIIPWDDMRREIRAAFLESDEAEYLRDALERIIQRPHEEVRNYALRFEDAMNKAYTPAQLQQELVILRLINVFAKGLKSSDVRKELHKDKPQTLERAITVATDADRAECLTARQDRERNRMEEPMEIGAFGPGGRPAGPVTRYEFESLKESVSKLDTTVGKLASLLTEKVGKSDRPRAKSKNCFTCGGSDHWKKDCPRKDFHKRFTKLEAQMAEFEASVPPKN